MFHRRISIHSEVTAPTAETGDGTEKHILTTCSQAGERLSLLPAGPASPWPYPLCHALLQLRRLENKGTVKRAQCAAFSRASLVGVEALQEEAVKARLAELRQEQKRQEVRLSPSGAFPSGVPEAAPWWCTSEHALTSETTTERAHAGHLTAFPLPVSPSSHLWFLCLGALPPIKVPLLLLHELTYLLT